MTLKPISFLLIVAGVSLAACGSTETANESPAGTAAAATVVVQVDPSQAQVPPAGTRSFLASVTGTVNTSVTWTIVEVGGGTIDASGRYVAPSGAGTFHVVARSAADPNVSASAVVTVTAASPPPPPPPPPSLAACANEPLRTTGTTYYVCDCQAGASPGCVAGNDSNAGTSKSAPWQSWAKAMAKFKTMNGGDTIAMCRGGAWTQVAGTCAAMAGNGYSSSVTILNPNCTASATCDWRDYDPAPVFAGTAKPVVRPADNVEIFAFGRSRFNATGYTATPIRGFRILNLDLAAYGNGTSKAVFVYGKTEDLEVCGVTMRDGFGDSYAAQTTSTIRRVNFHHNRLINNPFSVGQIRSPSCAEDCTFDSNYLDLNGGGTNRDHSIYVGSQPDTAGQYPDMLTGSLGSYIRAQRTRITNNEIYRSARGSGSTCNGSTIVVHEPHDDLVIENNLIYEAPGTAAGGCFGIQLSSGGDAPAAFRRASISRNQVYNVGNGGIDVSECADCLIESNLVVNAADAAIAFPGELATSGDSEPSARTLVRNNTVYNGAVIVNTGEAASAVEGSGHEASNNVACGKGWSVSGVRIGSGVTASNNQSPTSCAGLFVNPTDDPVTANFTPAAGSVLVGAGNGASFASKAIGTVPWSLADGGMLRTAPPDVGAFEK